MVVIYVMKFIFLLVRIVLRCVASLLLILSDITSGKILRLWKTSSRCLTMYSSILLIMHRMQLAERDFQQSANDLLVWERWASTHSYSLKGCRGSLRRHVKLTMYCLDALKSARRSKPLS